MAPCLGVFCVAIRMLDTFQMVSETVSFTEPRFGPGQTAVVHVCGMFSEDASRVTSHGRKSFVLV